MSYRQANSAVALSGALASGANKSAALRSPSNTGGVVLVAAHVSAVSGTSPTLDVKVQQSDTTVDGDFADVTGGALAQFTAAGNKVGFAKVTKAFYRVVGTVGGTATPTATSTVSVFVA
jgi:hypothetical protein